MSINLVKSDDDCFFFFNATCTKGDACPFRHSAAAYGSDVVCSFWREGKCSKGSTCKYRHMELRKTRNKIECFFEKQPGGCKKAHCPFLHSNRAQTDGDGEGIDNESVDPQSSDQLIPSKSVSDLEVKGSGDGTEFLLGPDSILNDKHPKPCSSPSFSPNSLTCSSKLLPTSPSSTVATIGSEPVSISIDIAEESENEPEDIGCSERKSIRLTSSNHSTDKNFGIKTLEQIRMEKVFRQNDVNRQTADPEATGTSGKQFRVKLKRKLLTTTNSNCNTTSSTSPGVLTTINTTPSIIKTTANESKSTKVSPPGLKIKSLDEIRKEKEQQIQIKSLKISTDTGQKDNDRPKKVIKIKRTHLDIAKPTSEPPTKIIRTTKVPIGDGKSVSSKPLINCNRSIIQATTSTKVQPSQQQSTDKVNLRQTPPTLTSFNPSNVVPKKRSTLNPKVSQKTSVTPPNPMDTQSTTKTPVPVATDPTNVSSQLFMIRMNSEKLKETIRHTEIQSNDVPNEEKSIDSDIHQSLEDPNSFNSIDDDLILPDDEDKYDSDRSSNLSLTNTDDQRVNSMMSSSSSSQQLSHQQTESVPNDEVNLDDTSSILKTDDDDLLEEDDLLADGESAPDDVAIEDEDDEFLKELEHVINS